MFCNVISFLCSLNIPPLLTCPSFQFIPKRSFYTCGCLGLFNSKLHFLPNYTLVAKKLFLNSNFPILSSHLVAWWVCQWEALLGVGKSKMEESRTILLLLCLSVLEYLWQELYLPLLPLDRLALFLASMGWLQPGISYTSSSPWPSHLGV